MSRRGKGRDVSTASSDEIWDDRGYYISYRKNAVGEYEYIYRSPEESQENYVPSHYFPVAGSSYNSTVHTSTQEPLVIPSISPSEGQFTPFSSGSKISNSYSTATTPYTSEPFNDCVDSLQIYNGSGDKNVLLVEDSTQPTAYGNFQTGLKSTLSSNDWQDGVFETIKNPSSFFKVGRVFKALWPEPAGNIPESSWNSSVGTSIQDQSTFTKVRRFVVVQEKKGFCLCLSLNTYNGQGTTKEGIEDQDYAAVYPVGGAPQIRVGEQITKDPFPIIVEDKSERIHAMSRLNFGRVYTVEHNVKVARIGRIPDENLSLLKHYFVLGIAEPQDLALIHQEKASIGFKSRLGEIDSATHNLQHLSFSKESSTSQSQLDPNYRVVDQKSNSFWRPGRVFSALWTEPAAGLARPRKESSRGSSSSGSQISETWLNGNAYTEIRRFVILANGHGNCLCSPIHTYAGQATLKHNVPDPDAHAIIYTSESPPMEHSYKTEDGITVWEDLSKVPIKVRSEFSGPQGLLHPKSRINYGKIYTVEKHLKVLNIGMVVNLHTLLQDSRVKPVASTAKEGRGKGRGKESRSR